MTGPLPNDPVPPTGSVRPGNGAAEGGAAEDGAIQDGGRTGDAAARRSGLRNPAGAVRATGMVTLLLEAVVVLFALAPIAKMGGGLSAPKLGALLAIVVLLVGAAGTLRRRWGWPLGGVCQALVIASGFLTGAMFVLGAVFGLIWISILRFRHTVESG